MTPVREQTQWMDRAMCVAAGMVRWEGFTPTDRKRVCHGCPVRLECANWMADQPPTHPIQP